eukprot:GDKI01042115.1.p1 GENE.GDKI01042115.1~~GDKI01042115.1.p1  ORF type:complete len:155 (+),score=51.38 GDKI01042115.1:210-674(+)
MSESVLTNRPYEFDSRTPTGCIELDMYQDPSGLWSAGIGATVWDAGLVLCKYLESEVKNDRHTHILSGGGEGGVCVGDRERENELFMELLMTHRLLFSPGSEFRGKDFGFVRICFAYMPKEALAVAMKRLTEFVEKKRKAKGVTEGARDTCLGA